MKTTDHAPKKRPVGRPPKGTVRRNDYRHDEAEVEALAAIRTHYDLRSDAAAVREALLRLAGAIRASDGELAR